MSSVYPQIDPDGLLEYSVVYTDRAVNHMSQSFQQVMKDISATLKEVYGASAVAVVPGSGTFGMEAVARQFAINKKCLVIRNGWFSYRWTQIFEMGNIPSKEIVAERARQEKKIQLHLCQCRSMNWLQSFGMKNQIWYLHRMWKHLRVCYCRMNM